MEVDFLMAVSRESLGEQGSPTPRRTSCQMRVCISVISYSNSSVKIDRNTVTGDGELNRSDGFAARRLSKPDGLDALMSSKR